MDRSVWNADELFFAALEIEEREARESFLVASCGRDSELRGRVERLLTANSRVGRFLDPPAAVAMAASSNAPVVEGPGTVIGQYKLLEAIGEGGMGVVYMAEQAEPVRRKVALKVIKPGMDSRQVLARFDAERQALAMMDHPNIARVLDADATDSGRPYFVMELVRGIPITEFCDREELSIPERLDLFVLVCRAVQHAHQKGVIHRDLKPSNILVTVSDGTPVPKVIDFGIAKATGNRLTDKTLFTGFTQLVGTPLYMSPEQAELAGVDVDTRSDIYSLGVLLYELLTGTTPFCGDALRVAAFDEMRRIIREEEPPKPSSRLSTLGQTLTTTSAKRKADPRRLGHSMRGDLDWIVMKALEKDRRRRYETANDFAADLMRHLTDQPVEACPPSTWYRLRKFGRRNRAALATAALVVPALAVLAIGLAVVTGDQAALRTSGMAALRDADRWAADGRRVEELEAVRRAESLLIGGREDAEHLRAVGRRRADLETVVRLEEARLEMASTVRDDAFDWQAGDRLYAPAFREGGIDVENLEAAEVARRLPSGPLREDMVAALDDWAMARREARGRDDPSWKHLLAAAQAADPEPWRSGLRAALAVTNDKAVAYLKSSQSPSRPHPSNTILLRWVAPFSEDWQTIAHAQKRRPDNFWLNNDLAQHYQWTKPPRLDEAIGFHRAALALRPNSSGVLLNFGLALEAAGRLDEAVEAYRRAIHLKPDYAFAYNNLGNVLTKNHPSQDGIAAYKEAVRLKPDYVIARVNLSRALYKVGDLKEALREVREALRIQPTHAGAHHNLGTILKATGAFDEAETAYREAIRLRPNQADTHNGLGSLLYDPRRDFDGAIRAFRRAIELDSGYAVAHANLGNALLMKGNLRGAVASYREAVRLKPEDAGSQYELGNALGRLGDLDGAVMALREAVRLKPDHALAHRTLGIALEQNGDLDAASRSFRRAIELAPNDAEARYSLGTFLLKEKAWDDAEAAFTEVIKLKPDHAEAHCNLGHVLREKGLYRAALAELRLGHKLGADRPNWRFPSARWVAECEALIVKPSQGPTSVP